ncbi:hypothetical protein FPZ43_01290 [Mucilaginibacter pallidiroseus]|uniref:YD repeat-containing protein n=1 Tax=Mucilaginibacter pallidiroseus TaxID=2599295 RepID=A0A563UIL7_9SPHI|nr:hypothetical protein [Mucilaginibacter pallidiroseus]TWR31143.1 hypothetical protein FPZ43_01290 [Mucilaginibacter pallidiroseus]
MKNFMALAIVALSLSACTKNNDTQPDVNTEPNKLLLDSVITYTTSGKIVTDYDYDSNNNLIAAYESESDSYSTSVVKHLYTYDAQNNLVKSVITRGSSIATFNYNYQNNIPTVVDYTNTSETPATFTTKITVQNDKVSVSETTSPNGDGGITSFLYNEQNLIKESVQSKTSSYNQTISYDFGTNHNPYLNTGNKWKLPDVPYANKNEILTETSLNNGSSSTTTYTYAYNQDGYPTKGLQRRTNSAGSKETVIEYKYIKAK